MEETKKTVKKPLTKTTKDGRILGEPIENSVPERYRNLIKSDKNKKKATRTKKIRGMQVTARTLAPIALQPDDVVELSNKRYQIRGLNQAKFNLLIYGFSLGMTADRVCSYAGINPNTLTIWFGRGEAGETPYTIIYEAIKEAKATVEAKLMAAMLKEATAPGHIYDEQTEEAVDSHGNPIKKVKKMKKGKFPVWQATAWMLERINPQYRLDYVAQGEATTNSGEEDLLMMDGTTLGTAKEADNEDR